MRAFGLTTSILAILNVVACGADESTLLATGEVAEGARSRQMRVETPGPDERHVQIGAHGSLASVHSRSDATPPKIAIENPTLARRASWPGQSLLALNATAKRSTGPKLTGYKETDCGGTQLGSYVLPKGADMTTDHCLEVKDPDTDKPSGRIKISCDGSGVAKACIWHNANDTSCELSEPFCLNIQAVDTAIVATGGCVQVKEHPNEKDSFARFTDFPADTMWPDCLVPPMSLSLMFITVLGGVGAGSIVLCCIWYACLAPPGKPKQMHGHGFGEGHGEGWGKGKGKGWGGEDHGELPANLPGVPPPAQAPQQGPPGKGMMKGPGMGGKGMMKGKPGFGFGK